MAEPRFFFTNSALQPIIREGREYKFIPVSVLGGRTTGVFDTDDQTDIDILVRAVADKVGISEISLEDAEMLKKKLRTPLTSRGLSPSEPPPTRIPAPLFPVIENAEPAASVAAERQRSGEITLPKIISMARVGKVNPPQPLVAEKNRMLGGRLGK